mmetsp:Transcript_51272/g.122915  ORF Transcript_51272/g.122915 Transcript_51272/m.122915 type:complete len:205 (+) Transcript_51272:396-1010(+)
MVESLHSRSGDCDSSESGQDLRDLEVGRPDLSHGRLPILRACETGTLQALLPVQPLRGKVRPPLYLDQQLRGCGKPQVLPSVSGCAPRDLLLRLRAHGHDFMEPHRAEGAAERRLRPAGHPRAVSSDQAYGDAVLACHGGDGGVHLRPLLHYGSRALRLLRLAPVLSESRHHNERAEQVELRQDVLETRRSRGKGEVEAPRKRV